jgi:hypothetical protein
MQMEDLFEDWEDFQRNTKILAERIAKAEGEQL